MQAKSTKSTQTKFGLALTSTNTLVERSSNFLSQHIYQKILTRFERKNQEIMHSEPPAYVF